MKQRIIIHIDANNAFLSWTACEQIKKGSKIDIRNKYAVIGGDEASRRGIVLAKSIPCKNKGITTGETIWTAKKKCPNLEVYPPNFTIYQKYSNAMYNYLLKYTEKIERYSIDECFLDYTDSINLFGDPIKLAFKIKEDIKTLLGFTVNIGIGNNKLTAKMASDFEKPDKIHTLFQNEIETKMWPLPVSELFMIGKKTSKKLKDLNINTIYELAHTNKEELLLHFKKYGLIMWEYANGIDNSIVEYIQSDPKSISTSTVLPHDYDNIEEIKKVLNELSNETGIRLRKNKMYAKTIFIWIKYYNFEKISKQIKIDNNINSGKEIYTYSLKLFYKIWNEEKIRGLCVGVSNLSLTNQVQLTIFNQQINNNQNVQNIIDNINIKYGKNSITFANDIKRD